MLAGEESLKMLDLNLVRDNLDLVRQALANRNFPADPLDRFVELDTERRCVISEADSINQLRNAASKEIGGLMQAGKRDEAEAKKGEVAGLKDQQAELEKARDAARPRCTICSRACRTSGRGRSGWRGRDANIEIRKWGDRVYSILR